LELTQMRHLHDAFAGSLSLDAGGFVPFKRLEPFSVRAIASDLILTAADAVETNLVEAVLHANAYAEWLGPNGRRMPGPDQSEREDLEAARAESEVVGLFRTMGSVLDCLSAVVIGVLRLPQSLQRADASLLAGGLDRLLATGMQGPEEQVVWARRVADEMSSRRSDPPGWLEWLVEMRNRVVHRGRQISTWLPRTTRPGQRKLLVETRAELRYLLRFEPHLRRQPWHPEMEALRAGQDLWLAEPTKETLAGLLSRVNRVVEAISELLVECWELPSEETIAWLPGAGRWTDVDGGPRWRLELASAFRGFDATYPMPPLTAIRTSGRDAVRLAIAERLRQADERA
jgi:hypothetical protein